MMKLDIQMFADGKVIIQTDLDKSGFEKGLSKIQSAASTGFKAIAGSIGVAATAMTALVGKSVTMAGELEQQIGGTEAVFGDLADVVQNKAAGAFETMGLSANDFMATANKMGALMQGSGLSIEDSMDLSTKAMQRAADVASIMGIDVNSAMESIAGAAKGNFTMMDNLGVAMNATTLEAYAMSKGIETSYNEMDNATKVGLAMEMFLEKTAYAEGNYAKENETFAGSFTTLKASIQNFLSGAGDIDSVIKSVMGFSKILIKTIGEMAPQVVKGIVDLINGIAPEIPSLIQQLLPIVIQGSLDLINGLVAALPTIIPILLQGIISALEGLSEMLPDILNALIQGAITIINSLAEQMPTLIPILITAILDGLLTILDNVDQMVDAGIKLIMGLADGIINALPIIIEKAPEIIDKLITALVNNLPKLMSVGPQLIGKLAVGIIQNLPSLLSKIPGIITSIVNGFLKGVGSFANVGKNLIKGLWNGINNAKDWVLDKIKGFGKGILNGLKSFFGIKSPSRVMRDEIGKYLAEGIGVGFDEELNDIYRDMKKAINYENAKLQANVETGKVFNTLANTTPIAISLDAEVEMDKTKVGRIVTPVVSETLKAGGLR